MSPSRTILVTGGAGFIGSNLADRLADPGADLAINIKGKFNLLEALRTRRDAPLIYASTNKVYGQRPMGTEDQGWVAHFLIRALEGRPIPLFGGGEQVRDICAVSDTCDLYLAALALFDSIAGSVLNWGGGAQNAVSQLMVIEEIERITGRSPHIEFTDWRPEDQRGLVADARRAETWLVAARDLPASGNAAPRLQMAS